MTILDTLIHQVAHRAELARVHDIRIGAYWTCVAFTVGDQRCAGLSSTLGGSPDDHGGSFPVSQAGQLHTLSPSDLLSLAKSPSLTEASVGLASINALLEVDLTHCEDLNAADVLAERGAGKTIAVVGHFPFIKRLRTLAQQLWVLELNPREGDLPADAASTVIPQADVVAITGTSLLNGTFESLAAMCHPDAYVVLLGATTPLTPVLFDYGVDVLSGTCVADVDTVMHAVSQGATFRQIKGKRLLTMTKAG